MTHTPGTVDYFRAALEAIEAGEGRYSRDPLTHCGNTVEAMQKIAHDALNHEWRAESEAGQ